MPSSRRMLSRVRGSVALLCELNAQYEIGETASEAALREYDACQDELDHDRSLALRLCDSDPDDAIPLLAAFYLDAPQIHEIRIPPATQVDWLNETLEAVRTIDRRDLEARCESHLGIAYRLVNDTVQSIQSLERSVRLHKEAGNDEAYAQTLMNLGNSCVEAGRYEDAKRFHQEALALAEDGGDLRFQSKALVSLAIVSRRNDIELALKCVDRALQLARKTGDLRDQANALANLATVYRHMEKFEKAIEIHRKRIALAEKLGDTRGRRNTIGNMANCYRRLNQLDEAQAHLDESIRLSRELNDDQAVAIDMVNLGLLHRSRGNRQDAIQCFLEAIEFFASRSDVYRESQTWWSAALTCSDGEEFQDAVRLGNRGLAGLQKLGDPEAEKLVGQIADWNAGRKCDRNL